MFKLLDDNSPDVQKAALRAASRINSTQLWPHVTRKLDDPNLRSIASQSLARGQDSSLPYLREAFLAEQATTSVQARVARIASQTPSSASTFFLMEYMDHPDGEVRLALLRGLDRVGYHLGENGRQRVLQMIHDEYAGISELLATKIDFKEIKKTKLAKLHPLLDGAVSMRYRQAVERIFLLLAFFGNRKQVRNSHYLWQQQNPAAARNARGIMRQLVPSELRAPLMQILIPQSG